MRVKLNDAFFDADRVEIVLGAVLLNGRACAAPEDCLVTRVIVPDGYVVDTLLLRRRIV